MATKGRRSGNGSKVSGCGMDMGFALVYDLGRRLWPEGGSVKKSQRRHQEERLGNKVETDGGYLLRHEWMQTATATNERYRRLRFAT